MHVRNVAAVRGLGAVEILTIAIAIGTQLSGGRQIKSKICIVWALAWGGTGPGNHLLREWLIWDEAQVAPCSVIRPRMGEVAGTQRWGEGEAE